MKITYSTKTGSATIKLSALEVRQLRGFKASAIIKEMKNLLEKTIHFTYLKKDFYDKKD